MVRSREVPGESRKSGERWFNRNVLFMGLTSLFSDASHEMATALLPTLLAAIGASPAALGAVEGLSDAAASAVKLLSGWYTDRIGRRKPAAVIGYAMTAVKAALYWATTWPQVLLVRVVAWLGRGLRNPPRDTMLAEAVPPRYYGRAFGFHRAMDTTGAVLGPLLASLLLTFISFRRIFLISLIPGLLAAAAMAWGVREPVGARRGHGRPFWESARSLPQGFRRFLLAVGIFGLGDIAHSLLILRTIQLLTPAWGATKAGATAILLYALHNAFYAAFSYPAGTLGDRVGKGTLLVWGYGLFAVMAIGWALAGPSLYQLVPLFIVAGLYLAIEDALEGAMTADLVPAQIRGTGYGVLATVNGIGDLGASVIVGLLWARVSPAVGFGYAAVLGALGALAMLWAVRSNAAQALKA
ncbi:MAG: MFS transporter [Bacillota bacterium]